MRTINLAAINLSIQFFRTLRTSRDRLTANAHRAAAGGHHVERKTRMICDNIYVVSLSSSIIHHPNITYRNIFSRLNSV